MLYVTYKFYLCNGSESREHFFKNGFDGKIYNEKGELLNSFYSEYRGTCTHIPCNHVTDTVWQHRHIGVRCDVYTANATWCKCCNTILKFNSGWVYSYTHYGCNK